jgi:hypothetical protein
VFQVIRTIVLVVFALAAFTQIRPASAGTASIAYLSATGVNGPCSAAQPCADFVTAVDTLNQQNGRIECINSPSFSETGVAFVDSPMNLTLDCAGTELVTAANVGAFEFFASNQTFKLRNFTISGIAGGSPAIRFLGSGTLILENCVLEDLAGTFAALDLEPSGPLNVVIRNSRISNSSSGILLKPAAGGSIKATFDHVVITVNNGGGIKSDSTDGVVNLDVSDSEISNNPGNGINLVGSANQNMLNLSRTVIAKNGVAGLQVNGATTAALVDTTLFDTNTSGATSVVGGGHVLTYGNNHIVGSAGSGFTGTAPSQ